MDDELKARLIEAHKPGWRGYGKWLLVTAAFCTLQALLVWSVLTGIRWPVVPLVVALGFVMHGQLMALHEAAHRSLVPIRWLNDAIGITIGTLSLAGFTAYQTMHRSHHARLASEHDEELWPFVVPATPLWVRRTFMVLELLLSVVVMPARCLRTFLRRGSIVQDRRRAWTEYVLMIAVWSGALIAVARINGWAPFATAWALPALVGGIVQGFRQCIEHMGLYGSSILTSTRTVVPRSRLSRLAAFAWFNIEYHGPHHLYGNVPHDRLPDVGALTGSDPISYPNYRSALREMLSALADPRIGKQWLANREHV